METQSIKFERYQSYDILLGNNVINQIVAKLSRMGFCKHCAVLTNELVAKWYLEPVLAELRSKGFEVFSIILPDGEEQKSLQTVQKIYQDLQKAGLARNSPLVTLGGGVIGDIGGFCAATWLRGIPFVQLPTTLLSMVDSSIGGKVGVNLPNAKNYIGSFYQPSLVGIDVAVLRTLPLTQISYGLVEAIKHGLIADPAYFKFITKSRGEIKTKEPALMQRLIRRSLNIKKMVVEKDELDKGNRAILNFGHTFGHGLEILGEYRRYHHGEAVSLGMLMTLCLSKKLGKLKEDYFEQLNELLVDFSLPVKLPVEYSALALYDSITSDKKRQKESIKFVIPITLGSVELMDIPLHDLPDLLVDILGMMK
ncbi:MAG: 3-dehydroquinate synthase [Candidatus Riflebacteria bacterium]|nr:3-dehydroquinate synthase [Candidatus Riflebacteria bacterium]